MAKKGKDLKITREERIGLYAARRFLDRALQEAVTLRIPFDVYFQDPMVAAANPDLAFNEDFFVPWEPGIGDGPTSARFAVVDYDGGTETLAPPARWDEKLDAFVDAKGKTLDRSNNRVAPISPGQCVGGLAACARLLRERLRPRAANSVGLRGQQADRRSTCRLWRERLLRPEKQVAAVLLFRSRQGAYLYVPVDRHHQSRIRPRGARRHPSSLPRINSAGDGGVPRIHGRPHGHSDHVPQQRVSRSSSLPRPKAIWRAKARFRKSRSNSASM